MGIVNHIRLCFLAYWLSARLGREWGLAGEHREVGRLLRTLQTIRAGRLDIGDGTHRAVMTSVPADLEETLKRLGLQKLFATPPARAIHPT